MKIRNGFVSNSSSSSFLVYGFLVEEVEELRNKLESYDENETLGLNENAENIEDFIWDHRVTNDDGDLDVFGVVLSRWEYFKDNIDIDLSRLDKEKKAICEDTKEKLGVDISSAKFRIIGAHFYC